MDGGQIKSPTRSLGLSAAMLDKRLGLRKRAREDAARDLPASDAAELSEAERAVLEAAAQEHALLQRTRDEAQAEAERSLRSLTPTPQDFAGPLAEARLSLKQAAGRVAHDWNEAAAHAKVARADLAAFKQANGLRRVAVYPESGLLQAGLLFCAALFEALFSAALFAEDDARGLLGGAITAIGLSGANVTLGFLTGFLGLRYVQHVRTPLKLAGAGAGIALAFLALALNLFAADWRDKLAALSGGALDMGGDASFHLWSLLSLNSPQAIILLMLGAGVWAFAAMKGYSGFDDPYPDYGKMDRIARDAGEELSELRAEMRRALEAPVDEAKLAITSRLESMRTQFEAMSRAFDDAALKLNAFDAQARTLDDAIAAAFHLYRQENTAGRKTPAPAYFGTAPAAAGLGPDPLINCAAMIDAARATLGGAQARAASAMEELVRELDAVTAQLDQGGVT